MKNLSKQFIPVTLTFIAMVIACANFEHDKKSGVVEEKSTMQQPTPPISENFKKYWYNGTAELTSFELAQARYGEIHKGKAVLIYVTEDFNPEKQVKADQQRPNNVPILKLNSTKKFNTGIYPYSVMTSTFFPVTNNQHAIKVTASMQEWCGHVFTQLNNRTAFDIQSYSYFERESDRKFSLEKTILEDELWTQLRVDPTQLPVGSHQIVPAFETIHMKHIPFKAYEATVTLSVSGNTSTYTINYPTLNRKLSIKFTTKFPHDITSWTETVQSGYGTNVQTLTTKATKIEQIKTPYWSKNSAKDSLLRKELGL